MSRFSILLLAVCGLLASVASQGPTLHNYRSRLPVGQAAGVACITPDLNGDGLVDLVRASRFDFGIWIQDHAGKFNALDFAKQIPVTSPRQEIVALATGRITSTRSRDVIVGYRSGIVQIYPNLAGVFGKPIRLPSINGTLNPALEQILVGDIDPNSNSLDELVLLLNSDRPVVYTPTGTRLFKQLMLVGARLKSPKGVLVDLDLDSDLDLLIVTGTATPTYPSLYLNSRAGFVVNTAAFGRTKVSAKHLRAANILGNRAPELFLTPIVNTSPRVRLFRNTSTVPGQPSFMALTVASSNYTVIAPWDFEVVDLNGDGYHDLVSISASGTVTYGLSAGAASPASFGKAVSLLPVGQRSRLCAMDLEGDGDTDLLVVGFGIEDSLLLGGPSSMPMTAVDTEAQGMPIGRTPKYLMEAIDVDGKGDLDLVLWPAAGGSVPVILENVEGQARFRHIAYTGQVPALQRGFYSSIQRASVTGRPGGYLVLGRINAVNVTGVQVWVPGAKAALDDQTLKCWRIRRNFDSILAADVSGSLAGSAGTAGYSDVVGIDSLGFPRIVFNRSGIYDKEIVISRTAAVLGSELLVTDLNLDGRRDILIVQPGGKTRVLLASGTTPDVYVETTTIPYGGPTALVQDLTGDLFPDLLISVPGVAKKLVFMQGLGNGKFVNRSGAYLANLRALTAPVVEMALLHGDRSGQYSLVLGFVSEPDQILRAANWIFGAASRLPLRGSHNTSRFLVHDFDLDGDPDLVIARQDTLPALLLGQAWDLCNVGLGQAGREALIHVAYPDLVTLGAIMIGFPAGRIDLGGLGILRLQRISVMMMVPSNGKLSRRIRLPLPAIMTSLRIPMQLVTVRSGALRFRNMDKFRPTSR